MARKNKDAPAEGAEGEEGKGKKAKGGKSNLVPAIIIAVGLVLGGKMMGGGTKVVQTAGAESTTTTLAAGEIVKLDSMTLNLADGHFLKVGIALQLAKGVGGGEGGTDAFKTEGAKAQDIAISLLGAETMEDLSKPTSRDRIKTELSEKVKEAFEGDVLGILFTEFVMQ